MRTFLMRSKMVRDSLSASSAYLSSKLSTSLCSMPMSDYEEVIKVLNSLRSNSSVLDSYKKQGKRTHSSQATNLEETAKYLSRSGLSLDHLEELSFIHVSGTKGKGSTCAFCESILRHHGFKTGFYSSPHLVAVRERIQINGKPLTHQEFSKYFWPVYDALYEKREHENDMPPYFKFLTIMAFHVFLAEKVDVAVIEVGIGGEYDCTNVIRRPAAVGVTSLGMDHTSLLGSSIEDIAWQKAGIFKLGARAFTVQQPPGAWPVLQRRAVERSCCLQIAPPLDQYDWRPDCFQLHFSSSVQTWNASLALQLANAWLEQRNGKYPSAGASEGGRSMAAGFPLTPCMVQGLSGCSWPGRLQVLHRDAVTYFLDGAHTVESVGVCAQWFAQTSQQTVPGKLHKRVLVFNATGERKALNLLKPLLQCQFEVVIFCPNIVSTMVDAASDIANFTVPIEEKRCKEMQRIWDTLQDGVKKLENNEDDASPHSNSNTYVHLCVGDALSHIERNIAAPNHHTHVLVTGSLYLVGCVLTVLDPDLSVPSRHCIQK